jgi:hypothetical protein
MYYLKKNGEWKRLKKGTPEKDRKSDKVRIRLPSGKLSSKKYNLSDLAMMNHATHDDIASPRKRRN